ncbi:MAG: hypothetical protein IPO30_20415 [Hyphomonadaceae bacterium]|nr:hypothetical protein [Hyphomonadaceae bacterium]
MASGQIFFVGLAIAVLGAASAMLQAPFPPVSIIEVMAALVDHASEPLWLEAQYNACQIVVGGKLGEPGIDGALRSLGRQLSCMLFLMYQLGIVGILLSGGAY